jgi:hypothetical protein
MGVAKRYARIGFVVGFLGALLFYASPMRWFTYESRLACPLCPYIDVLMANWLTWLQIGMEAGLVIGLVYGLIGFGIGFVVAKVRAS